HNSSDTRLIHRGCYLFFFFFQAEDGIRDRNVTGVQTCALPIFAAREQYRGGRHAVVGGVVGVLGEAAGVVLRLEAGVDEGLDEGRARRRVDRSRRPGHDASSHTRWTARVKRSTPWSISSGVTTSAGMRRTTDPVGPQVSVSRSSSTQACWTPAASAAASAAPALPAGAVG